MNLATLAGEPASIYVHDQQFRVRPGTVRRVAKLQAWINRQRPILSSTNRPPDKAPPPAAILEARAKAEADEIKKWKPPEAASEEGLAFLLQTEGGIEQLLVTALEPEHPEVDEAMAAQLAEVLSYQVVNLIFYAFAFGLDTESKDAADLPKYLRPPTAASPGTTTPATSDAATESVTTPS